MSVKQAQVDDGKKHVDHFIEKMVHGDIDVDKVRKRVNHYIETTNFKSNARKELMSYMSEKIRTSEEVDEQSHLDTIDDDFRTEDDFRTIEESIQKLKTLFPKGGDPNSGVTHLSEQSQENLDLISRKLDGKAEDDIPDTIQGNIQDASQLLSHDTKTESIMDASMAIDHILDELQ